MGMARLIYTMFLRIGLIYKQIDESMKEYTEDIIENTEQVYIDPSDDEEIINLIEKLNIQS